jgi:hypothetical protein
VYGCDSTAHPPAHVLVRKTEVNVCNFHRDELSKPDTAFDFVSVGNGKRELRTGFHLRALNEFTVVESPNRVIHASPDVLVRHPLSFPLTVLQRGKDKPETITVVMTPDQVTDLVELIHAVLYGDEEWIPPYGWDEVSEEVEAEGWATDRIRELQELRKSIGLDVSDRISVVMSVPPERADWAEVWRDEIAGEILATTFEFGEPADGVPIGDGVWVAIAKA